MSKLSPHKHVELQELQKWQEKHESDQQQRLEQYLQEKKQEEQRQLIQQQLLQQQQQQEQEQQQQLISPGATVSGCDILPQVGGPQQELQGKYSGTLKCGHFWDLESVRGVLILGVL